MQRTYDEQPQMHVVRAKLWMARWAEGGSRELASSAPGAPGSSGLAAASRSAGRPGASVLIDRVAICAALIDGAADLVLDVRARSALTLAANAGLLRLAAFGRRSGALALTRRDASSEQP